MAQRRKKIVCKNGKLKNPVKTPSGGMRYCKKATSKKKTSTRKKTTRRKSRR